MPAHQLIEDVSALALRAAGDLDLPAPQREQLDRVATRLREPLRVAVVGRVKAGKSTLVNALLGQRVAPTDVSECTKVVTWFHYGHPQRLAIEHLDGRVTERPLDADGRLPDHLGVPIEQVARLHVYLANEGLRQLTIIDTPGTGSANEQYSDATEQLIVDSRDGVAETAAADAIVFLLNQVLMQDELDTLRLFAPAEDGSGSAGSAATAVGVLSRADQLGDGIRDSWDVAVELARTFAGRFHREVATVVPVIGLLAESAEAAHVTEGDAMVVAELARLEPKTVERALWSVDRFLAAELPTVGAQDRQRLLELLDLYGIARAVTLQREADAAGTGASTTALRQALAEVSGIAGVKATLSKRFRDNDHVLKVRSALDTMHRMTFGSRTAGDATPAAAAALARLRTGVEELRLSEAMHPVAELEAWHDVSRGVTGLDDAREAELARLFEPGSTAQRLGAAPDALPSQLADTAKGAMQRWRQFMVTEATPPQAQLARVAMRSYQLIWKAVRT